MFEQGCKYVFFKFAMVNPLATWGEQTQGEKATLPYYHLKWTKQTYCQIFAHLHIQQTRSNVSFLLQPD